jgi:hypothetical protein
VTATRFRRLRLSRSKIVKPQADSGMRPRGHSAAAVVVAGAFFFPFFSASVSVFHPS